MDEKTFLTFELCMSIITLVVYPLLFWYLSTREKRLTDKIDKQYQHQKNVGKQRILIEEAETKMAKFHRIMSKETAVALRDGKSNGDLTRAIKNFDDAFDKLEEEKETAIMRLKKEYQ